MTDSLAGVLRHVHRMCTEPTYSMPHVVGRMYVSLGCIPSRTRMYGTVGLDPPCSTVLPVSLTDNTLCLRRPPVAICDGCTRQLVIASIASTLTSFFIHYELLYCLYL